MPFRTEVKRRADSPAARLSSAPHCAGGGIGRRARLRALWASRPVEVRVLFGALQLCWPRLAMSRGGQPLDAENILCEPLMMLDDVDHDASFCPNSHPSVRGASTTRR